MPSPYIIIGGSAYQPGSAAAKRAQELYNAMPKPQGSNIFAPVAPRAPAFPFYPTSGGAATSGRGMASAAPSGRWFDTPPSARVPATATPAGPVNTIQGTGAVNTIQPFGGTFTAPVAVGGGPAGAGGGANLVGTPGQTGMGPFGLVPQVPSPVATAGGAISGNISNLPGLTQLGTDTTKLGASLGALPYQANLPGYEGLIGQSSENIAGNLAGIIKPTTWESIQQAAGERGVATGAGPGSPNFDTGWMRALGLTSEAEQALGEQQLTGAIARTPTGQPFNIAGQQINPADMQAAQYAANVAGAAPDPTQAAQANLEMLLKSIEAGRAGGLGGIGGGGGGGIPRMAPSAPGVVGPRLSPVLPSVGGGAGGWAPRMAPTAPGTSYQGPGMVGPEGYSNTGGLPGGTIEGPGVGSGEGYSFPGIGGSVFDPYSLGGYGYNATPTSPGRDTQPAPPETGTPAYGELDPWTQDFLDQYGIDWSVPSYESSDYAYT